MSPIRTFDFKTKLVLVCWLSLAIIQSYQHAIIHELVSTILRVMNIY